VRRLIIIIILHQDLSSIRHASRCNIPYNVFVIDLIIYIIFIKWHIYSFYTQYARTCTCYYWTDYSV